MLCPANVLGVVSPLTRHLGRLGPCGVRRLAAAVCRPGSPGRAATPSQSQSPTPA